jgi:hypothetical protein
VEPEKPSTNKGVIFVVVSTLAFNATVGMSSLAYCLILKIEPNVTLLSIFVNIVTFLFGAVAGMLVKTSPTETTKAPAPLPSTNGATVGGPPAKVEVVNQPNDPVPTTTENKL